MTRRKRTQIVFGVLLAGVPRKTVENLGCALFLERKRWLELWPQDGQVRVEVKTEDHELARREILLKKGREHGISS